MYDYVLYRTELALGMGLGSDFGSSKNAPNKISEGVVRHPPVI